MKNNARIRSGKGAMYLIRSKGKCPWEVNCCDCIGKSNRVCGTHDGSQIRYKEALAYAKKHPDEMLEALL